MIFILNSPRYLFLLILTVLVCPSIFAQKKNILKAYGAPEGIKENLDFTVKVRQPGAPWQDLPEYNVMIDRINGVNHSTENASMVYFDFSGTVEVAVTFNRGNIETSRIRPLSYNIPHRISGRTVSFVLNKPANLSLEINGDIFHNLHLFANPIESFLPDRSDKRVIFFGPGVHQIPSGALKVASGSTVYVAGGAVLKGKLIIDSVENVKVIGRGMIDQAIKGAIRISNSKNIEIEGLFVTQCLTGGSKDVTIRNVKCISYYKWGDGMNVISSQNVLIDGVFNRNSDDCTTVYGTRLGFVGGCKNITMKNSTLWADVAHPILVGTHGNTQKPEVLEDLTYMNIDILDHKEKQIDYQGCLSLNAGDSNLIRNVRFENIRVEDFREGQLFNIRVFFNAKYCTSPGMGVENVLFKNINYTGKNSKTSIISGYDEQRKVKNIVFENLVINGTVYSDDMPTKPGWFKTSDMAGMFIGDHVDNIKFIKTNHPLK